MENTYENYLRRPVYTFNNVQFLNSSKMKLKKASSDVLFERYCDYVV